MGLCENMRSWRWRRGASMGVMLLGISLAQAVSTQGSCSAGDGSQNITQPQYHDTVLSIIGAGFLSPFVQNFLYTVQPSPFPDDLILTVVQNPGIIPSDQDFIKKVLVYEVGFLVCVAIGVLYIVLMPIVGFCLSCCRCCGNCGGKMYQKQTSSIKCLRRTLYWSTLMITIIILAGNICMFRSNQALKASVNQSPDEIRNIIDNVYTYLSSVPQQVNDVVNESNKTIQQVTRNLNNIGPQIGGNIQLSFNGSLYPALQSVKLLSQETLVTKSQLDNLNSSLVQLQSSVNRVQTNITSVKDQLNQTLHNPNCTDCSSLIPELQKLTVDISINVPNLQKFQSAVNDIISANLSSKISQAENNFDSIPQMVTNETKDIVKNSKQVLGDINQQISKFSSEVPLSALDNVSNILKQAQNQVDNFSPQLESAENIRWSVCVALCCIVLLVVVCNLLGLVLGPLGLTPSADPTNRSHTADCGGIFFMMGAGFSFLFSWLFMVVVLLLFLLGGNIYTLLCQPWSDGQLLKIVDTPGLIPGLEIGPNIGLKTKINISDLYSDCEKNKSLWATLHLNELIDLQALLNISKYTGQIQGQFNSTNITLSIGNILSPDLKSQLGNFSANLENINTSAVTQQMNSVYLINLNQTAEKITNLSKIQTNSNIKQQLTNEATRLTQIQADIETNIYPQMKNLNSSINTLQLTTQLMNGSVGEVLSTVGAAQDFLNTNTTQIVKTESRRFLDCQLGYFTAFTNWANLTITQKVGRCGPVAGAVDSLDVMFCSNIVESLNAFWFSLGWCVIFFIPSIICSIKLAKYYRRMKHSNSKDDNHILMSHIPRAQMKII